MARWPQVVIMRGGPAGGEWAGALAEITGHQGTAALTLDAVAANGYLEGPETECPEGREGPNAAPVAARGRAACL